jgi:type II secretory pathway component PulK
MTMRHPLSLGIANQPASAPRQGFVLVAVLLVVVVLALAAYQFSASMTAEYAASDKFHRAGQARSLAKSGIDYSMVLLSNPTNFSGTLNNNPYDNAPAFQNITVQSDDNPHNQGVFDIIAPLGPDALENGQTGTTYGVTDESSKFNINALFALDSSGTILSNFLMTLPNMTEDIANSIIDWIDPDDDPRENGAESDYYSGLSPPYQAKNGPLDSIEELLLVKGVTPQLLFGNDQNRNGQLDPGEDDGTGASNQGWSAYITVFSRERNVSSQGVQRININSSDLSTLYDQLSGAVGPEMAAFIVGYRIYSSAGAGSSGGGGAAAGGGGGQTGGGASGGGRSGGGASGGGGAGGGGAGGGRAGGGGPGGMSQGSMGGSQASMAMGQASMGASQASMGRGQNTMSMTQGSMGMSQQGAARSAPAGGGAAGGGSSSTSATQMGGTLSVQQLGDLTQPANQPSSISSMFSLVNATVTIPGQNGQPATSYASPLNNSNTLQTTLPLMLDQLTTQGLSEIPARLNINTASQTILAALPGLTPATVQTIVDQRPTYVGGGPADTSYSTTAWLMTQGNIPASTMQGLDRYVSASSQVYRVQAVGYFTGGGPTARIEAVVDTNAGMPRLMYWRDLSELGKGYTPQTMNQQ